jgi:hypothetical protein
MTKNVTESDNLKISSEGFSDCLSDCLKTPFRGFQTDRLAQTQSDCPTSPIIGQRPRLFVRTVHQIWIHHPILGDLPFGPRHEIPGIPFPIDRFSFDDPLDAHEACLLLEDYFRRHPDQKPPRKRK